MALGTTSYTLIQAEGLRENGGPPFFSPGTLDIWMDFIEASFILAIERRQSLMFDAYYLFRGIGKTTMVRRLAKRIMQMYPIGRHYVITSPGQRPFSEYDPFYLYGSSDSFRGDSARSHPERGNFLLVDETMRFTYEDAQNAILMGYSVIGFGYNLARDLQLPKQLIQAMIL